MTEKKTLETNQKTSLDQKELNNNLENKIKKTKEENSKQSETSPQQNTNTKSPNDLENGLLLSSNNIEHTEKKRHLSVQGKEIEIDLNNLNIESSHLESIELSKIKMKENDSHGNIIAVNNNYICFGLQQGAIRSINRTTKRNVYLRGHLSRVIDLNFWNLEEGLLVSISEEGSLIIWDVNENKSLFQINYQKTKTQSKLDKGCFKRVIWHPIDKQIAACGSDNTIYIWSVDDLLELNNLGTYEIDSDENVKGRIMLLEETKEVIDYAFSPDGIFLFTACKDGTIKSWDYQNQVCVRTVNPLNGLIMSSLAFCGKDYQGFENNDYIPGLDSFIVIGCENNKILKLFNIRTWDCLQTITFNKSQSESINTEETENEKEERRKN